MVDAALVTSRALGLHGQMWLHAAPAGGATLMRFYGTICHLGNIRAGFPLPGSRVSDGRHFFATSLLANQLLEASGRSRKHGEQHMARRSATARGPSGVSLPSTTPEWRPKAGPSAPTRCRGPLLLPTNSAARASSRVSSSSGNRPSD
jgi:hypothetical protein